MTKDQWMRTAIAFVVITVLLMMGLIYLASNPHIRLYEIEVPNIKLVEETIKVPKILFEERTVEIPKVVIATAESATSATGTNSDCPEVAIRVEPQGLLQSDGSFVASIGAAGCITVFEGRIWESGKGIQNRHDMVMIDGAKDNFRYWEGNGWTIPSDWVPEEFACLLWEGKQENWLSQGITPLPVRFWNFLSEPTCISVQPVPAPSVAKPTSWPSTASEATAAFGGTADRWESCPGEIECWHLKEGDKVTLSVPDYAWLEGWSGTETISRTNGPVSITVVGATIRPK